MIEIIEAKTWSGHRLDVVRIGSDQAHRVPCHILWPEHMDRPAPFILATHGATSSKHEWTELDGYTKGGNLAQRLLSMGIAVVAMDWHYHGDNDTQTLGGRNVFLPEHFDDFFERSVRDANTVLEWTKQHPLLDATRMGFSGYSLAATFGFWLAGHGAAFKAMVLCVLTPAVNRANTMRRATIWAIWETFPSFRSAPSKTNTSLPKNGTGSIPTRRFPTRRCSPIPADTAFPSTTSSRRRTG